MFHTQAHIPNHFSFPISIIQTLLLILTPEAPRGQNTPPVLFCRCPPNSYTTKAVPLTEEESRLTSEGPDRRKELSLALGGELLRPLVSVPLGSSSPARSLKESKNTFVRSNTTQLHNKNVIFCYDEPCYA